MQKKFFVTFPLTVMIFFSGLTLMLLISGEFSKQYSAGVSWFYVPHFSKIHVFLLLYGVCCLFSFGYYQKTVKNFVCAGMLLVFYQSFSVCMMGDSLKWLELAQTTILFKSEIFCNLLYYWAMQYDVYDFLTPVSGFFNAVILFECMARILKNEYQMNIFRFCYMGSISSWLYFYGYFENTFFAMPWAVLCFFFLYRYYSDESLKHLYMASFFLGIAWLFHGQYTMFFPAVLALPLIRNFMILDKDKSKCVIKIISWTLQGVLALVITLIIVYAGVILVEKSGFLLHIGNTRGGGDSSMFVFWSDQGQDYFRFTMLSMRHLYEIGCILLFSSPPGWISFLLLKKYRNMNLDSDIAVMGILALLNIGFVTVWNFDLGFPADLDLMCSMGIFTHIFICTVCIKMKYIKTALFFSVVGMIMNAALFSNILFL